MKAYVDIYTRHTVRLYFHRIVSRACKINTAGKHQQAKQRSDSKHQGFSLSRRQKLQFSSFSVTFNDSARGRSTNSARGHDALIQINCSDRSCRQLKTNKGTEIKTIFWSLSFPHFFARINALNFRMSTLKCFILVNLTQRD